MTTPNAPSNSDPVSPPVPTPTPVPIPGAKAHAAPMPVPSDNPNNPNPHRHPDLAKVAELIKDVRVAFMHTMDSAVDGVPLRSRPMYTQRIDPDAFDGVLWFFTDTHTTKVTELQTNPNVLLTYADTDKNRYVVVKGTANCEHNPAKARELWNIHAKGWWPEGPESDSLMLIHVRVTSAEYWDGPSDTSYLLHLVKAVATGERIDIDTDHGRIGSP